MQIVLKVKILSLLSFRYKRIVKQLFLRLSTFRNSLCQFITYEYKKMNTYENTNYLSFEIEARFSHLLRHSLISFF